jgi:purine-binding chemotaxis protein CheW
MTKGVGRGSGNELPQLFPAYVVSGHTASLVMVIWSDSDMDILAARKKAAEQASARNKPDPEAAAPAVQPNQEEGSPPAPVEAPAGGTVASPPEVSVASDVKPVLDTAISVPDSTDSDREAAQQREIEMLSFRLGEEEYAVPVSDVREVLKLMQPTTVPNTPDYILGVTSLRGTMLPIIDLCKRFGLPAGVQDEKSRIVVVTSADEEAGLQVDRVTGVFSVFPDEIKPAPENIEQGAEFLRGIVRKEERLYIILDLEKTVGV